MNCYVFAVGNLPDPILQPQEAEDFVMFMKPMSGLIGVHPMFPQGTLLAFDTLDNARFARDRVTESGNQAGHYIMNAEISENLQTLTINGPALDCRQ